MKRASSFDTKLLEPQLFKQQLLAAIRDDVETAELPLTPSNINDFGEITLLHWAAVIGYESLVQLLLDRGADLEVVDNKQQTALESMSKPYALRTIQQAPHHQIISIVVLTGLQASDHVTLFF